MKSISVLAIALCALAPAALAQPADSFRDLTMTKTYDNGPRAGTQRTLRISRSGAVTLSIRDAAGETRSANNQATPAQLQAVLRAFADADVRTLPGSIVDPNELLTVGELSLDATFPGGQSARVTARLNLYAGFAGRVRPLVDALDVLDVRLEPQVRAGFRSIHLKTTMTGGPAAGRVSVLGLGASSRATFELSSPSGHDMAIHQASATPDELEAVIRAFEAAQVRSIPDGFIFDPRELATFGEIDLRVVLADGTKKSLSARLRLYGDTGLGELVEALSAIGRRLEAASTPGLVGSLTGS